jgi:hypothetical protein
VSDINDRHDPSDPDAIAAAPSQPVATVVCELTLVSDDVIADADLKYGVNAEFEDCAADDGGPAGFPSAPADHAAVADDRADISDGSAMLAGLDIGFLK